MMNEMKYWSVGVFLLLWAGLAMGATIRVPEDHATIQAAINASIDGDEIEVAPGTYYEYINFKGKAIHLYSSGGPDITIIDGGGIGRVVECHSGETSDTVLEGFTITGGSTLYGGGGMNNKDNSSPTVTNCKFIGNYARWYGAGMNNWNNSNPTVTGCTFQGNYTESHGGGMRNGQSSPTVTNCVFIDNSVGTYSEGSYSGGRGGGLYNDDNSSPIITGCRFSNNTGYLGGGMSNEKFSSPTLTDCVFTDNSTISPEGIAGGGGMYNDNGCNPTIMSCTFNGNTTSLYGGGIHNCFGSSPTVTDCTFSSNSAVYKGGGIYNRDNSNPEVTNCTFSDNSADAGGGMSNVNNSNPEVTNCTFSGNSAITEGGGMHNGSGSSPTVTDCAFTDNYATGNRGSGGGMSNDTSCAPAVSNCTFSGNTAVWAGGGMRNKENCNPIVTSCVFVNNSTDRGGGGMSNAHDSNPRVLNCTFKGNSADYNSGGIDNWQVNNPEVINCTFSSNSSGQYGGGVGNWQSNCSLTNCTFTDNSSTDGGGGLYNDSSCTVTNCIFWANSGGSVIDSGSASVTYSDIQGGWTGIGNIDADPFFADSDGRLSPWSPCLNAGDNSAVTVTTDLDGNPRIYNNTVDMGAYECMSDPENTPPGQNIEVTDPETCTMLLFDSVDSGGHTTVTMTENGPPLTGLKLVPLGTYYEIDTTAEFTGMIQIAIHYDDTGLNAGQERALKLRIYEEAIDEWINITTFLDTDNNIVYGVTDHLSFFAITMGILVEIDIKPGSYPNAINLRSYGLVPLAIFSDEYFDATTVDPATIELAGSSVAIRGNSNKFLAHEEDIDGDDLIDLLVQVETDNLDPDKFQCGFVDLIGQTYDSVPIKGEDEIMIVPPEQ